MGVNALLLPQAPVGRSPLEKPLILVLTSHKSAAFPVEPPVESVKVGSTLSRVGLPSGGESSLEGLEDPQGGGLGRKPVDSGKAHHHGRVVGAMEIPGETVILPCVPDARLRIRPHGNGSPAPERSADVRLNLYRPNAVVVPLSIEGRIARSRDIRVTGGCRDREKLMATPDPAPTGCGVGGSHPRGGPATIGTWVVSATAPMTSADPARIRAVMGSPRSAPISTATIGIV